MQCPGVDSDAAAAGAVGARTSPTDDERQALRALPAPEFVRKPSFKEYVYMYMCMCVYICTYRIHLYISLCIHV